MKELFFEGQPLTMYHQECHACTREFLAPIVSRVCFMCATNKYKQPQGWFK